MFHGGKLARNGRRLSMAHRSYKADHVYADEASNEELCVLEVLPLLEKIIPTSPDAAGEYTYDDHVIYLKTIAIALVQWLGYY